MGIQINGNTNNINAGIGSLSIEDLNELHIVGVATAANFKTGTSNLHSTGLNIFDLDVDGQTNLDHVSVAGVTTFSEDTKFIGALSGRDLQWDKSDNTLEFLDYTAAKFGTDNNLTIYHNAGNNNTYITENGVGSLLIGASDLYFQDVDSGTGHYYMICATGGRVQLNYDNSEKLRTTNAGITVTGAITATGTIETTGSELKITGTEPRLTFTDTDNNPDFQIWANAQRLSIYDSTNSATRIRIDSSGNIGMNTTTASDSTGSCRAYTFTRTDNNGQVRIILKNGTTGFGNGAGFHQGIDGVNAFIENRSEGGYLDLTTKHGGTVSTKLRIKSDGHALFNGLTSQDAQDTSTLAVQDGDSNIGILQIHSGGGETVGDLSGIAFSHGNDNITARAKAAIALRAIGTYGKGDLCFYVDTADDNVQVAAADEKLRITSAGNLALGNTHGAKKIHISTYGNQKILIDPNYNNNSGGSSNTEANANNVVDSILIRSSFGDNAASQTNSGHKWGIKFQGYNGNDFNQNTSKIAAVYAVSEDEATGYNKNVGLAFHTSPYNTTHREAMRINTNGYVTKPYHPAFCATRNGASHIQLHQNSNIDVVFTSVDFDNSGSYNNSNGRFTAPVAGKYYFGVQFYCGFSVTSVRVMHAAWRKNGSVSHEADLFGGIGNFGNASMNHYHPTTNAHVMLELAKNDYVTFNTGTNSFIGSGNTYLYATKGTRFFGHLVC